MGSLSSFSFSLTSFNSIAANNNQVDLTKTCKNLSDSDPRITVEFCITSLQADPRSRGVQNFFELGLITLKLVRNNVTDTRVHINKLFKAKKLEPSIKGCLDNCLHIYSDAISTVRDSIRDYRAKNYGDSDQKVRSILDASTACEDDFHYFTGQTTPLTDRNNDTLQLCAIAQSVIDFCYFGDN